MIYLKSFRRWLFVSLVVAAPFSYLPSISLPLFNFTSFRLGAYQLLALIFILLNIVPAIRGYIKEKLGREARFVYGALILLLGIAGYKLTYAIEPGRSLLMTLSFCFLIVLVYCARSYARENNLEFEKIIPFILKAGVFYGAISVLQLIIATINPESALLCKGCNSDVFGFPRINGFAAEPLFWANALMPIWLFALDAYIKNRQAIAKLALIATTLSITLTFSRGAYLAVFVMGILYVVINKLNNLRVFVMVILVGVFSVVLMVVSAAIRYNDSPGIIRETASGIVEHLSFGRINFAAEKPPQTTSDTLLEPSNNQTFDSVGYVEASTTERTSSAELALRAWRRQTNLLLGVGLGNLGPYVVSYIDASAPSNLTVYIYYVLLLAEMGILGLGLVLGLYFTAIRRMYMLKDHIASLMMLILVGFLVHYLFFGSYINVVYIWLWLGVALGYHKSNEKAQQKSTKPIS